MPVIRSNDPFVDQFLQADHGGVDEDVRSEV